jgi:hypothetical protein
MSNGSKVLVLYQISNSIAGEAGTYNAFEMPRGSGVTLSTVKQNCLALRRINRAGSDGYHWRVRVDDKPSSSSVDYNDGSKHAMKRYSWWDIQDENARLPVKEVAYSDLSYILAPRSVKNKDHGSSSSEDSVKGAMRSLGKAMTKVANVTTGGGADNIDHGPFVPVIMFKLVDLTKIRQSFRHTPNANTSTSKSTTATRGAQQYNASSGPHRPIANNSHPPSSRPTATPRSSYNQQQTQSAQSSLMDFGPTPTSANNTSSATRQHLHHTSSAPPSYGNQPQKQQQQQPQPKLTRAEQLKKEYEQKKQTENRVWDEVDQRWVTVNPSSTTATNTNNISAPPGSDDIAATATAVKGISLDPANAIGKSAHVAAAVNQRVNEMKHSQQKAVQEIRQREFEKKQSESEEDVVRQKLEPKIKAWSEEHGKKKQLRALLSSLHLVLWPGAGWKPVNLGDILEDKKCRLCFHKASRVVHPDKTMSLGPEERFLAKRIFDALSQAKSEFDNSK